MPETTSTPITEWVYVYADDMYRFAYSRLSNREEAEDIVQNTFVAALQALHSFEHKSSPKTWLFAILKNKIMDFHRKRYRQSAVVDDGKIDMVFFDDQGTWTENGMSRDWETEHLLDNPEFNQTLQGCMDRLPPKWLAAIQYKYLENRDTLTVCSELGISQANYWQLVHRAKIASAPLFE